MGSRELSISVSPHPSQAVLQQMLPTRSSLQGKVAHSIVKRYLCWTYPPPCNYQHQRWFHHLQQHVKLSPGLYNRHYIEQERALFEQERIPSIRRYLNKRESPQLLWYLLFFRLNILSSFKLSSYHNFYKLHHFLINTLRHSDLSVALLKYRAWDWTLCRAPHSAGTAHRRPRLHLAKQSMVCRKNTEALCKPEILATNAFILLSIFLWFF